MWSVSSGTCERPWGNHTMSGFFIRKNVEVKGEVHEKERMRIEKKIQKPGSK